MVERANSLARDRDLAHVEELDLGQGPASRLRQNVHGGRALHLKAVQLAPAGRVDGGALVPRHGHVVVAGLGVVLDPVVRRGTSHESNAVLTHEEEDPVADYVSVVVARHELLCLVDREVLERVHAERRQERDHIGPFDAEIGHVMRLIEQRRRLPPGDLLVHPVRELARHGRIHVRPDLRVPRHLDRVAGRLQLVLEAVMSHLGVTSV